VAGGIRSISSKIIRSLGNIRTFSSFKNRAYRFYFGGVLGHMACMNMQQVPNGLLLERLTNSPAIVGVMSLAGAMPMLFLSFIGGVIADRIEKKFIVLIGQAGFALTSLGTAIALNIGYLNPDHPGSWWVLVATSAIQGGIMGVTMPSRQAILSDIVRGDSLMNAISLNFLGTNAVQVITPALSGFLVNSFSFASVYYTMSVLYLISLVMFAFVPRTGTRVTTKGHAWTEIKDGLKYVWHQKTVRLVLVFSFIAVLLSSPYGMLMPFFADDILHVGAGGMGILLSVSGVGAIIASIILASLPNKKRGLMMQFGGFFLGVALIGFAASKSWPLSLVLIALIGIGNTVTMTLSNTLIQYYADDSHRGRVMSLFMMQFGLSNFGILAAGLIAQKYGVQWAVGIFALPLVFLPVLALISLPRLRKLD
jgi:MFS family permease